MDYKGQMWAVVSGKCQMDEERPWKTGEVKQIVKELLPFSSQQTDTFLQTSAILS